MPRALALAAAVLAAVLSPAGVGEPDVVLRSIEHGDWLELVPPPEARRPAILVVVHGTLGADADGSSAARTFAERWTELARAEGAILVAPVFDDERYGGRAGPGGGYRGLFGRDVGADEFLHAILADVRARHPDARERIVLYGHSAGGQFASRYVVKHPERVERAVLCAAGTFAFPAPDVPWTNGMAPLERRIRWSDDEPWRDYVYAPDPAGWLHAAQLPIAVVAGADDTEPIPPIPGNPGANHVERARAYVDALRALAAEHDVEPRVELTIVPGVGHDSARLTAACQVFAAAGL